MSARAAIYDVVSLLWDAIDRDPHLTIVEGARARIDIELVDGSVWRVKVEERPAEPHEPDPYDIGERARHGY